MKVITNKHHQITNLIKLFELGIDRDVPDFIHHEHGLTLNVGAGNKVIDGARSLDLPEWDADKDPIPFPDGCVTTIYAFHFLEHVRDPVKLLLEFQRVLVTGGVVNILVPYYSSVMQAQDLDHKSSFAETTWRTLFRNQYYDKNKVDWKFDIGGNLIIGLIQKDIALLTQLVKS